MATAKEAKKTVVYNEAGFEGLIVGCMVTEARFTVMRADGKQVEVVFIPNTTARKGSLESGKGDNIFVNGRTNVPGIGAMMLSGNLTPVGSKDHYGIKK